MHRRTIGYCGGIGSGKSTRLKHIAQWWDASGSEQFPQVLFKTIDADIVGHKCYEPGSEVYHTVVKHFSQFEKTTGTILCDNVAPSDDHGAASAFLPEQIRQQPEHPPIDRKKLGSIVFADKERMNELNQIMWPAIASTIAREISNTERDILEKRTAAIATMSLFAGEGHRANAQMKKSDNILNKTHLVYAVEAAILPHMSDMLKMCDEVWLYDCNEKMAVKRIMERNRMSQEAATARVAAQSKVEEKKKLIEEANKTLRIFDTTAVDSEADLAQDLKKQDAVFAEMLTEFCEAK